MRGRSLIQRDEDTDINREDHAMSQRETGQLQAKGQLQTYSANTLIFDLAASAIVKK